MVTVSRPSPSALSRAGKRRPEPLWREALGNRLRLIRTHRRLTLAETAERAGISPQYLSEIERGRKEPSSEMIAAIVGALGMSLVDLTALVSDDLRRVQVVDLSRSTGHERGAASAGRDLDRTVVENRVWLVAA
ncbi:hypothetical protein GCM10022198_02480 [Klugiella xanthotipulae]|uniref:Helix-turn-helix protein n=1 Tax=Klugiella xanthotipulae TaxID=244735 RepID=A0A543I4X1_9MICO|nr:helix-turn-helix transcriptional regulator [Klugiella xanthotipulae]TQM65617.1 helix-turn-helix protein [Klugiella xanthotipulae]